MKMKTVKLKTVFLSMVAAALLCISWSVAHAEVEWSIRQTIDLSSAPVDVAMSPDWQKMFVLTENGEILIYSSGSAQAEKITVGGHVDRINAGPHGNVLTSQQLERQPGTGALSGLYPANRRVRFPLQRRRQRAGGHCRF